MNIGKAFALTLFFVTNSIVSLPVPDDTEQLKMFYGSFASTSQNNIPYSSPSQPTRSNSPTSWWAKSVQAVVSVSNQQTSQEAPNTNTCSCGLPNIGQQIKK